MSHSGSHGGYSGSCMRFGWRSAFVSTASPHIYDVWLAIGACCWRLGVAMAMTAWNTLCFWTCPFAFAFAVLSLFLSSSDILPFSTIIASAARLGANFPYTGAGGKSLGRVITRVTVLPGFCILHFARQDTLDYIVLSYFGRPDGHGPGKAWDLGRLSFGLSGLDLP